MESGRRQGMQGRHRRGEERGNEGMETGGAPCQRVESLRACAVLCSIQAHQARSRETPQGERASAQAAPPGCTAVLLPRSPFPRPFGPQRDRGMEANAPEGEASGSVIFELRWELDFLDTSGAQRTCALVAERPPPPLG